MEKVKELKTFDSCKVEFETYFNALLVYEKAECPGSVFISYMICRNMLFAFVCELGLKAIICEEGKTCKNIHYLDKLFKKISKDSQDMICKLLDKDISEVNRLLSINANNFVQWRYFTESKPRADIKLFEDLAKILALLVLGEEYVQETKNLFCK